MSIRYQVVSDGYEQTYSNGSTVIPILDEEGRQRVRVDSISGGGVDITGPLGQAVMASSVSVTMASNQTAMHVVVDSVDGYSGYIETHSTIDGPLGPGGGVLVDTELPAATTLADATINPSTTTVGSDGMVFNGTTWDRSRGSMVGAQSSATGYQNVLSSGRYNATPPALTDGQFINLQLNSEGDAKIAEQFAASAEDNTNGVIAIQWKPLSVSTYTPTVYSNFAGSITGGPIKASPGNLFTVVASNANVAVRFLQIHNTIAKPAGAAVPVFSWAIPALGQLQIDQSFFSQSGVNFATGISWSVSTTLSSFTDSATAGEHTIFSVFK